MKKIKVEQIITILATIVNRVDPDNLEAVILQLKKAGTDAEPIYVLPEDATLGKPTVGDIVNALNGEVLQGASDSLAAQPGIRSALRTDLAKSFARRVLPREWARAAGNEPNVCSPRDAPPAKSIVS